MRPRELIELLFGRRALLADDDKRETVWTIATLLTVVRATLTTAIFIAAIIDRSRILLIVALGISMLVDFFDGFAARSNFSSTTLTGAQFDGAADRLAAFFVLVGSVLLDPEAPVVVAASLVGLQFVIVDLFLTNQFLRFGLWSPDHFYVIDERTWKLNWSPPAKLASNVPIALLALGGWPVWLAGIGAFALIVFRLPTYQRVREQAELRIPELGLARPVATVSERREPKATTAQRHHPPQILAHKRGRHSRRTAA